MLKSFLSSLALHFCHYSSKSTELRSSTTRGRWIYLDSEHNILRTWYLLYFCFTSYLVYLQCIHKFEKIEYIHFTQSELHSKLIYHRISIYCCAKLYTEVLWSKYNILRINTSFTVFSEYILVSVQSNIMEFYRNYKKMFLK